ncbi:MAG: family 78 glycoside hydrolase catalytic domain [Clostridia bacterium]|nr:family 78 glycoside hydrolase catalytic domain [Clostridia bacterium]
MKNILNAQWIKSAKIVENGSVEFTRELNITKPVKAATLEATAYGVYEIEINGKRVGDYIFAPGWTSYQHRLQVETYDITSMLGEKNTIRVGVAGGWKTPNFFNGAKYHHSHLGVGETAIIAALEIEYTDGTSEIIYTDENWLCSKDKTVYSHIYNGYTYDATFIDDKPVPALPFPCYMDNLMDRVGEKITEHEHLPVKEIITTPKGETVLDFGQNMTGYVQFRIKGNKGEKAVIRHAEVLDAEGNFYNDNYRSAKAEAAFICDGEEHIFKPAYNFFGFRYIKLENWSDEVKAENFTAIVVHSDIKRTGYFECSDERINKLFSNIIWGQKGNFLDVPTDCPQRDERLGWTGDAQVFIKTASYNYDVEKFFIKWLGDLRADQTYWGAVPHVIPNTFRADDECSAAWADASTVCPWQIYQTYGNKQILEDSLKSMRDYLEYIEHHSWENIWAQGNHFGDWLNLDGSSPEDCSHGTDKDLIATAFFIYSSELYMKSCAVCGKEADTIPELRAKSIVAFRNKYMKDGRILPEYATQTACVLACHFGISDNIPETAKQLNELVTECGHLKTGFVGTPYLLHALSDNGYTKTAYDILLREEYPSWLFSVKMGATTIWEHWDSMREDGSMWSTSMNSFNHYAYGSVADWLYGDAAGIKIDESKPAFEHIIFAPVTDERLDYVKASIESRHGAVKAEWKRENGVVTYTFTVPEGCTATVVLNGKETEISAGEHRF